MDAFSRRGDTLQAGDGKEGFGACSNQLRKALLPQREAWTRIHTALRDNQKEIDSRVTTIASGRVDEALLGILNQRANQLWTERETLLVEQRRLAKTLPPLQQTFDATAFHYNVAHFDTTIKKSDPAQVQRLLRLIIQDVEWGTSNRQKVNFYALPITERDENNSQKPPFSSSESEGDWFDFQAWSDAPYHAKVEPIIFEFCFENDTLIPDLTAVKYAGGVHEE